jgi:transcription-repair coupling factor (superfamily II helicase)
VVEEAVAELKEEEFSELAEKKTGDERKTKAAAVIETDIEALIPEIYIEHDSERLDIYRRLYRCESLEDINMMRAELKDRFGEYPEEVEHMFLQIELKVIAANIGFIKVELNDDILVLNFPPAEEKTYYEDDNSPFQRIMGRVHELKLYHPHLKQDGKQLMLTAKFKSSDNQIERLDTVRTFLEKLELFSQLPLASK